MKLRVTYWNGHNLIQLDDFEIEKLNLDHLLCITKAKADALNSVLSDTIRVDIEIKGLIKYEKN